MAVRDNRVILSSSQATGMEESTVGFPPPPSGQVNDHLRTSAQCDSLKAGCILQSVADNEIQIKFQAKTTHTR
jgi:hypothetical protein